MTVPEKTKSKSLEDRIRALCTEVLKSGNEEEMQKKCAELRAMLSDQIDLVRARVRELKALELDAKSKKKA